MENEPKRAEVVRRPVPRSLIEADPIALAQHFADSGYFKDSTEMSQAVVKIAAGQELGVGPMAAMQGIFIIEGKPSYSAGLVGSLVQHHPAYDYRVGEHDAQHCTIRFYRIYKDGEREHLGDSTFTIEQAREIKVSQRGQWIPLASTARWRNYPQAMLFARALTQGIRWYCPEVTSGAAYTPEEMGYDERGPELVKVADVEHLDEERLEAEAEEVDGEVVAQEQPEPEPAETITKKRAAEIYDMATTVERITPESFAQAVAYAIKHEVGDLTTKTASVRVLREMTAEQADVLIRWIEKEKKLGMKAAKAAKAEGGKTK